MYGTQTWDHRMVGAEESTELNAATHTLETEFWQTLAKFHSLYFIEHSAHIHLDE